MMWQKLGNICEFKYGSSLPASARSGDTFPVYGSNGVVGAHLETLTDGPTIIVGRKGSIGEVNFSDGPCWPIDTTYFIDRNATKADLRWLSYALSDLRLGELNKATGVPGLNRNDAYEKLIFVPPLGEQKRIAAILDQADDLRRKRQRALDRLNQLGQAIFLEMFGDPVTNPFGFPVRKLGELGDLDRGISKHRPRNDPALLNGDHPLIQTGDVANADGYIRHFSSTYSDLGLRQSRKWPVGTLCITIAANIGKTAILEIEACFPDSVVGFTSNEAASAEYVQHWMERIQKRLEEIAPKSAQKNINLVILRELPIPVPPVEMQDIFATRVKTIEAQKIKLRDAGDDFDRLFHSLQHRAFSGDLMASDLKEAAA